MIKLQERSKVRHLVEKSIALSKTSRKRTWSERAAESHSPSKQSGDVEPDFKSDNDSDDNELRWPLIY
jgi:hypothetical protein